MSFRLRKFLVSRSLWFLVYALPVLRTDKITDNLVLSHLQGILLCYWHCWVIFLTFFSLLHQCLQIKHVTDHILSHCGCSRVGTWRLWSWSGLQGTTNNQRAGTVSMWPTQFASGFSVLQWFSSCLAALYHPWQLIPTPLGLSTSSQLWLIRRSPGLWPREGCPPHGLRQESINNRRGKKMFLPSLQEVLPSSCCKLPVFSFLPHALIFTRPII